MNLKFFILLIILAAYIPITILGSNINLDENLITNSNTGSKEENNDIDKSDVKKIEKMDIEIEMTNASHEIQITDQEIKKDDTPFRFYITHKWVLPYLNAQELYDLRFVSKSFCYYTKKYVSSVTEGEDFLKFGLVNFAKELAAYHPEIVTAENTKYIKIVNTQNEEMKIPLKFLKAEHFVFPFSLEFDWDPKYCKFLYKALDKNLRTRVVICNPEKNKIIYDERPVGTLSEFNLDFSEFYFKLNPNEELNFEYTVWKKNELTELQSLMSQFKFN